MNLTSRTARSLASAAAVALLVSGCSDDSGDQTNTTEGTPSPTATPSDSTTPSPDSGGATGEALTASDAIAKALEAVPGDVVSVDLENASQWEVLVRTPEGDGTEVWLDAVTGEVSEQRSEQLPSEVRDGAPQVDATQAIDAALGAVPTGAVTDLDIDRERGKVVWDVVVEENGAETDVQIDATTGEVLSQESDN